MLATRVLASFLLIVAALAVESSMAVAEIAAAGHRKFTRPSTLDCQESHIANGCCPPRTAGPKFRMREAGWRQVATLLGPWERPLVGTHRPAKLRGVGRGDNGSEMKIVFDLAKELKENPQRVAVTQALTQNPARPEMGLRGTNGLFGSDAWWENLRQGKIPTVEIAGTIKRAYRAGHNETGHPDMIELETDDGLTETVGIYVNDIADVALFKPGRRAAVRYALEELKKQPNPQGGVNYSRVAVEMAVGVG